MPEVVGCLSIAAASHRDPDADVVAESVPGAVINKGARFRLRGKAALCTLCTSIPLEPLG